MKEYEHEFADHWFFTANTVENAGGLQIIRSGQNRAKYHYYIGPRFIPYFSFHCVLEGKGTYIDEGKEHKIKSGDVFCLYPNHIHSYFTDINEPLEMFWIAFDGTQAVPILDQLKINSSNTYIRNILSIQSRFIIEKIIEMLKVYDKFQHFKKLNYFYQLIDQFYEEQNNIGHASYDWIQESINYINLHYAEGIAVSHVARHVNLSRSHFSNTFTKIVGKSPNKYLQEKIMKRATILLTANKYSISEIALSLSFTDVYSFSRAFKNYYQISPTQYKKFH